jgi:hypothetical protein
MANTFFYLITDQPTTCPICGARTDIISSFFHTLLQLDVNECLDTRCKYVFFEVEE